MGTGCRTGRGDTYRAGVIAREGTAVATGTTPPRPVRVDPLMADLGSVQGHRVVLLSLEVYDTWADLRFARIDDDAVRPLPRRVPSAEAWTVRADGEALEVLDAVGRGTREFSNGEVRMAPPPLPGVSLEVAVTVVPGTDPLVAHVAPGGA
jgi:hypothetical protein